MSRGTDLRTTKILTEEKLLRFVPGKSLFVADADVVERFKRSRTMER